MKWVNGETCESKEKRKKDWHRWFAWYPVTVDLIEINGRERKVKSWLEYVERKGECSWNYHGFSWNWTYRVK